ncbi:hypothetical protein PAE9249_00065 [Paenibacillus sp. CECT 9249]|nr:hypothetical protein PAE9249_00065 [Paenibacillus sp. CECT 9249]
MYNFVHSMTRQAEIYQIFPAPAFKKLYTIRKKANATSTKAIIEIPRRICGGMESFFMTTTAPSEKAKMINMIRVVLLSNELTSRHAVILV